VLGVLSEDAIGLLSRRNGSVGRWGAVPTRGQGPPQFRMRTGQKVSGIRAIRLYLQGSKRR